MALSIVILAAGRGKRMASHIPKIMRQLGGMSLLERVVRTAEVLQPKNIHVVYGNGSSIIQDAFSNLSVNWVHQEKQLGTGHAVMQALPACDDGDQVLVLYGDVPLISPNTLRQLLDHAPKHGIGLLVTKLSDPTSFGRIIRDHDENIVAIVEEKDATAAQRVIQEINTGIITAPAALLRSGLPRISNHNAQNEFYLTDMIALAVAEELPIHGVTVTDHNEVRGVNDPWQLVTLERYYQYARARELVFSGVHVMDPARLDVRGQVTIAPTTQLDVNVVLEGDVSIGASCTVGPNVCIKNTTIGDNVTILANSVIDGAVIENHCIVGPFARVRPGTVLKEKAQIGNFVEVKKTRLGENSKACHLTYLGDAIIGQNVNIGAGTITCNYDGVNKWQTEIGDGAFIGSNTSLIAPIQIGVGATIAAGSSVGKYVPPGQLTITRAKQMIVKNWKQPVQKNKKEKVAM